MSALPVTESKTFMALPPATRLTAIERVHHCIDLLYSLPAGATRNDCINVLDEHLHAVFAAHYDEPIREFVPRFVSKPTLSLDGAFSLR